MYQIMLAMGQYASVIVEQHGVDVVIRVSGTDGKGSIQPYAVTENGLNKRTDYVIKSPRGV
jgi:hypothetical protein